MLFNFGNTFDWSFLFYLKIIYKYENRLSVHFERIPGRKTLVYIHQYFINELETNNLR